MSEQDRLDEIKQWRANDALPGGDDIDWLIQIADLYTPLVDILHAAPVAEWGMGTAGIAKALVGEVERLRGSNAELVGLLARLEWAHRSGKCSWCPDCEAYQRDGHEEGCELAAAIGAPREVRP